MLINTAFSHYGVYQSSAFWFRMKVDPLAELTQQASSLKATSAKSQPQRGRPTSQQAREGRKRIKKEVRGDVKASKRRGEEGRANRWSKGKREGKQERAEAMKTRIRQGKAVECEITRARRAAVQRYASPGPRRTLSLP
jgi:hypothetical protein